MLGPERGGSPTARLGGSTAKRWATATLSMSSAAPGQGEPARPTKRREPAVVAFSAGAADAASFEHLAA